jgi:hypothetical protein
MPTSPFELFSGLGILTALAFLTLTSSLCALIASVVLLHCYRRTVRRLTSQRSVQVKGRNAAGPRRESPATPDRSPNLTTELFFKSPKRASAEQLIDRIDAARRRQARKYAMAGMLFALLVGLATFSALSQTQINYLRAAAHPLQALFLIWTFAWPVTLITNLVACSSRWVHLSLLVGYFSILALLCSALVMIPTEAPLRAGNVLLPAWSGETPLRLASKWVLFNGPPSLLCLAFRHRRVRAVAPLVLAFTTAVSAGILFIVAAAFRYKQGSVNVMTFVSETFNLSALTSLIAYFVLLIVAASFLFGLLGWSLLVWIRARYRRKMLNDQSTGIDAMLLIFSSSYTALLAFAGPGWALAPLIAFLAFKAAVSIGNKGTRPPDSLYRPALLVLRVFSLGARSEFLFNAITKRWRHIGDVRLIAGADLALSSVAPQQFLAFVSGTLGELFANEPTSSLDLTVDSRSDADGLFRINDFFCHSDTWQSVLSKLVRSTDVVLMDLRNFTARNAGCLFEIRELMNTIEFRRLVFVIDSTTDRDFLEARLAGFWNQLPADSPNLGLFASALRLFEFRSLTDQSIQKLLRRLCAAA